MEKSIIVGDILIRGPKTQIEKLETMLAPSAYQSNVREVRQYIELNPSAVLSERISRKGVALITVALPKETKELQLERVMSGKEKFL